MSNAGEFKTLPERRRFLQLGHGTLAAAIAASTVSIVGPREGVNFTIAPGVGGDTSTTPEQPRPPAAPSRQVRRAAARARRKAARS